MASWDEIRKKSADTSKSRSRVQEGVRYQVDTTPAPKLSQRKKEEPAKAPLLSSPSKSSYTSVPSFESQINNVTRYSDKRKTGAELQKESPVTKFLSRATDPIERLIEPLVPNANREIESPAKRLNRFIDDTSINIPGKVDDTAANFLRGAGNTATLGLSNYIDRSIGQEERADAATDTLAGKIGGYVGEAVPAGAAWKAAGKGIRVGNRFLQSALRGGAAGAGYAGTRELAEEGLGANDQTLQQRLGDVAFDTALGVGGDLLGEGIGAGIRYARNSAQDIARGAITRAAGDVPANRFIQTDTPIPAASQAVPEVERTVEGFTPEQPMQGNWFTNMFGKGGVGISASSSSKRVGKDPLTTKDQIVRTSLKNDKQGIKDEAAAQARATYQNFVDYLSPLKKLGDTYDRAMDSVRGNNIANTIVRDKFVNPEGQVIGEGLENIFKKVGRGYDKDFKDYLILRHAKTRMERGENVYDKSLNMTPEKVQANIDSYNARHPEFQNLAGEWDSYNDNILKNYGVNEGLISEDLYRALREKNPNYAPMRRQFLRSEKPGRMSLAQTSGSSFSGQKAPIKEVSPTGSHRRIVDPAKSTIEATGAWVNAAMRNRTLQGVANELLQNPKAYEGIVEIVQKPKDKRDLREVLLQDGEDEFVEALNEDFRNIFSRQKLDQDNIVRVMVNGEPVHMKVQDPEIVKALMGMASAQQRAVLQTLGAFSNLTKRGATGALAPLFAVKGATMDLVQSAIQSKNPVQQAVYTIGAIGSGIADKLAIPGLRNWAQEFRRAGGEYSSALRGDKALDTRVYNMTRYPLASPQNVGKLALNTVKLPFKVLEAVGDVGENAPRIAAARIAAKQSGGSKTPTNVRNAMSAAREATVNFSRKGNLSQDIESIVPYNNAAIQGIYRIGKALKDNPVRTAGSIAALAVLPKITEYLQFADDPDYQQLPARERFRNLIIHKNEDGTFTKIPMEPGYNAIGEMVIAGLRRIKDDDPQAFKGALDALANAYTPPLVTGALQGVTQNDGVAGSIAGTLNATIAAPAVGITANKMFTGAPVVSRDVEDRSRRYQYDERTSAIGKTIGDMLNMSPMQVDYLLKSYGGDPARLLLPLTSDVGSGTPRNVLLKNFIADPATANTLTTDFYDAKDRLDQAYRDNQEVGAPFPAWYDDELRKQLNSRATSKGSTGQDSILTQLSSIKDEIKSASSDKSLTAKEKASKIRDYREQQNEIYARINAVLYERGIIE